MVSVKDKTIGQRGTTIVELTVAVAIIATVFAAIMPLFAGVRNSADAQWANLEMAQNARVLNEQLGRCLAGAGRITAVSSSASSDGYIQFEAADGAIYRCELEAGGYVEFGPVGDLSELVGPVESLRFVCYDGNDLSSPAQTPDGIRLVTWEAGLQSAGALTRDKTVRGACYLRVAAHSESVEDGPVTYDFATGQPGVDCFAFADQSETQVPEESGVPVALLTTDQYDPMGADDAQSHALEVSDESQYAQLRMTFQIDQDPEDVASLVATWSGKGVNAHSTCADGVSLYIWNCDSSRYELIQASPDTDAEITLTGSGSGAPAAYVGGAGGIVVLLVVSNDEKVGQESNTLFTDYVKVDVVTSPEGGAVVP
ncbi:MAG: type II secretion system protein [Phycisphaerales bacterium]